MDKIDRQIITSLQEELPLVAEPYKLIADNIGITVEELLERLKKYRGNGQLRKVGGVIRHLKAGYIANALCVWQVPEGCKAQAGEIFSAESAVTHCYERVTRPKWRYNFYTMVQAKTHEECQGIVERLAQRTALKDYRVFFSIKEWKKSSMGYFREERDCID